MTQLRTITTQALLLLTAMLLVVILALLALAWRVLGERASPRGNQLTRLAQRLRDADARCDAALAIVTERR